MGLPPNFFGNLYLALLFSGTYGYWQQMKTTEDLGLVEV